MAKSLPRARARSRVRLGLAAHKDALHFLGGLELEVFAQVAVCAGVADLLRVRGNLFS
jgi:hypothetical protein